jgi:glycosyltransferase involved in cell wall biosynthesis
MRPDRPPPKVSIGLPVYNGERYVAMAIESILAQTYDDFELIISDNASTDRTAEICRRFAGADPRVRYHRQPANLGAAANFNYVFELAEGSPYFKWAAYDDWIAPTFLEKCVDRLEQEPGAVLCQSLVEVVDADGRKREHFDHTAHGTDLPRASDRFRARLLTDRCMDLFGVIRSDVLASTPLIATTLGADRALLIELALCGRFVLVPETLFFNRDHDQRLMRRAQTPQDKLAWFAPDRSRRATWRTWSLYEACLRLIRTRVADRAERRRCYGHLLSSLGYRWRWANLLLEPVLTLDPRLFRSFSRLKRWAHARRVPSQEPAQRAGRRLG